MTPFGMAPADFNAGTIIDVVDVRAFMKVHWQPATSEAFSAITDSGLTLNLDGVGTPHHLFRSWVITDLTGLSQSPVIVPAESGLGLYILRGHGLIRVYTSYVDFTDDLTAYLTDGQLVQKVWSMGDFDDASAVLAADIIDIQRW